MLDEQKNIYQSAMEEHEQSCRDALKRSRRIFLEKQKKEVNRRNAEQTMAWKKDYQALKEQKTEELFEMVKEKLLRITSSHIEYVFDCLKQNTTYVRNIKKYLLASLFNAPSTIGSYYSALVNHDMYGGGLRGR